MMVASLDPVGKTVSMVSLPRDLVNVPLGNGDVYGPKLNSLMSYADRHPTSFPKGGVRALEDAVGALLGIPIHYYARIDFVGFIEMVDAVGGVDINVKTPSPDPHYDGFGLDEPGLPHHQAGTHHLDGAEALAYARIRKGARRERLHAGRPPAGGPSSRCATGVTTGGSAVLAAARPARRRRPTRPDRRADRRACRARRDRRRGIGDDGVTRVGHPPPAGHVEADTQYGSSLVPNLTRDPGGRRATLPGARRRADPVADAEADEDRPRPTRPLARAAGPAVQAGARLASVARRRPRREPASRLRGRASRNSPRWAGATKPSVDGVVEPAEQRVPVAVRVEQADRLGVQAELRPRRDLGQLLERARARRAAR